MLTKADIIAAREGAELIEKTADIMEDIKRKAKDTFVEEPRYAAAAKKAMADYNKALSQEVVGPALAKYSQAHPDLEGDKLQEAFAQEYATKLFSDGGLGYNAVLYQHVAAQKAPMDRYSSASGLAGVLLGGLAGALLGGKRGAVVGAILGGALLFMARKFGFFGKNYDNMVTKTVNNSGADPSKQTEMHESLNSSVQKAMTPEERAKHVQTKLKEGAGEDVSVEDEFTDAGETPDASGGAQVKTMPYTGKPPTVEAVLDADSLPYGIENPRVIAAREAFQPRLPGETSVPPFPGADKMPLPEIDERVAGVGSKGGVDPVALRHWGLKDANLMTALQTHFGDEATAEAMADPGARWNLLQGPKGAEILNKYKAAKSRYDNFSKVVGPARRALAVMEERNKKAPGTFPEASITAARRKLEALEKASPGIEDTYKNMRRDIDSLFQIQSVARAPYRESFEKKLEDMRTERSAAFDQLKKAKEAWLPFQHVSSKYKPELLGDKDIYYKNWRRAVSKAEPWEAYQPTGGSSIGNRQPRAKLKALQDLEKKLKTLGDDNLFPNVLER